MTDFATAMPLLARHEGVWDGTYSYFNAQNDKIDELASRLFSDVALDDFGETVEHGSDLLAAEFGVGGDFVQDLGLGEAIFD